MRLSPSIVLLRTQTDERLVALAGEGSEPAFEALVERYRRMVLRACMRVLPEARAEDATQQVFLAAWKALGRGDEVRAVKPWLLRIARNTALNALRTPGYEYDELAESLGGGTAPQAELEQRDVMRRTLRGLAALPENQREALLRTAVQGASHADIARDLGISEGATRQLVLRARATLRSAVSAITPIPLLHWAANGSGSAGIAEVAAGGSTAGVALLAKAGAVVVIAGGAAATPAIVHEVRGDKPETAQAADRPQARAPRSAEPTTVPIAGHPADGPTATPPPAVRRRTRAKAAERPDAARGHHGRHRGHADVRGRGNAKVDGDPTPEQPGNGHHVTPGSGATTAAPTPTATGKGKGPKKDKVKVKPVNENKGPGNSSAGGNPEKPVKTPKPVKTRTPAPTPVPTEAAEEPTPTATSHGHNGRDKDPQDDS